MNPIESNSIAAMLLLLAVSDAYIVGFRRGYKAAADVCVKELDAAIKRGENQ